MQKVNIKDILAQYRPVVPEIQRDYVWGNNTDVLAQFMGDLNHKLGKTTQDGANIGFLYSYPRGDENYIIDGQQRLTTMLLLLHFLSCQDYSLHADFQNKVRLDGKTTAFAYRVRPTSLSFMKMLFAYEAKDSKSVRNLKDYKLCYDEDPTVNASLKTLDWLCDNIQKYPNLTYKAVLEKVKFWYFSVDETSQGEELYITMNSRGERLTKSEHIKPRLFDKLDDGNEKQSFGKAWDSWEEFFYRHKDKRSIESVDAAMDNMLRIVVELKTGKIHDRGVSANDAKDITLHDVRAYMSALMDISEMAADNGADAIYLGFVNKEISRLYGDDKNNPDFADGDFNVLKTLLTEHLRHKGSADKYQLAQVYHLIRNLIVRGILKSSRALLGLLKEMKESTKTFYAYMLECSTDAQWHDVIGGKQEPAKIKIFIKSGKEAEQQIWIAQETTLWKGNIKPLLDWATVNGEYSVSEFDRIHVLFKTFFSENKKEGLTSNLTRRALLTFNMTAYPWWQYPYQAYFGHTADEWRQIILKNPGEFKNFLEAFAASGKSPEEFCESRIKECPVGKDWYEFVEFPYLLEYLNTKHVTHSDKRGLFLEKGCYAQQISVNDEHLYHILKKHEPDMLKSGYWVGKDHTGNDNWVLVTDNIAWIGIWYEQELTEIDGKKVLTDQNYVVRIQKRGSKTPEENQVQLKEIADYFKYESAVGSNPLIFQWSENRKCYLLKVPFPQKNDFTGAASIIIELLAQLFATPMSEKSRRLQQ